jgi:hypothetical protein
VKPVLHRLPSTSTVYWQGWNRLRAKLGDKFHPLFDAVSQVMAQTPASSSLVENLNSRLRNYFTLRRHLGGSYLDLLRFFLNHRRFMRSRRAERNGKSPRELMIGQGHPHLADAAGPRADPAPARLTRRGRPPPDRTNFEPNPALMDRSFSATSVTQKSLILNHALHGLRGDLSITGVIYNRADRRRRLRSCARGSVTITIAAIASRSPANQPLPMLRGRPGTSRPACSRGQGAVA